jgi:molybdopterin/thiamine biosynthesis adenylyltransferase
MNHLVDSSHHATTRPIAISAPGANARGRRALVCGVGSVGRPLVTGLSALGVTHVTIVDPKCYSERSVATQCSADEVYCRKVDVVAMLARQAGLQVAAFADDIGAVPEGILSDDALLISCADNTRALVGANRLAARMQRPLLKVNVEPLLDCMSVRAYRPCSETTPCALCQLSDRHFRDVHPHSCDAVTAERHTAGSRELAAAAAQLALRAAHDIFAGGDAAQQWFDRETQGRLGRDQLTRSRLERYENCRWDHSARWINVFRLTESPADVQLTQLVPPGCGSAGDVIFDFDHPVTRWACCNRCSRRARRTRWITSHSVSVGNCPACGGWLAPFPLGMSERLTARQLRNVMDVPLANWGVARGAVVQVTTSHHIRTFVIGNAIDDPHQP